MTDRSINKGGVSYDQTGIHRTFLNIERNEILT